MVRSTLNVANGAVPSIGSGRRNSQRDGSKSASSISAPAARRSGSLRAALVIVPPGLDRGAETRIEKGSQQQQNPERDERGHAKQAARFPNVVEIELRDDDRHQAESQNSIQRESPRH